MSVRDSCGKALAIAETYFRLAETQISPAQWVPWEGDHNWRFVEKSHSQLLIQKLARQITGLKAFDVLLRVGLLQEVGVILRTLDEIGEDILFISQALITGKWTDKHDAYVAYFWSENDTDKQPPVRRKFIRGFNHRCQNLPDPSSADSAVRSIHKTYSDYVHARSAPIMAMVHGPEPATFDLDGIADTSARQPYIDQAMSYHYRCMVSAYFVVKAVCPESFSKAIYATIKAFERDHAEHLFTRS